LEELALKAAVQLHCIAENHRSRARRYQDRLTGPDALRRSQSEIDHERRQADENEALFNALTAAVIEVRIQRQQRAYSRRRRAT
jgi:hypothetical protein